MSGRIAFFIVDGLPRWLVRKALAFAPDRLPNLAVLTAQGRFFGVQPLEPNCQTPPSIAALLTGLTSEKTRLTGFDVPVFSDAGRLRMKPAFSCLPDKIELIWDRAATADRAVHVAHLPYLSPRRLGEKLQSYVHGFGPPVHPPQVLYPDDAARLLGNDIASSLPANAWKRIDLPADGGAVQGLVRRCTIDGTEQIVFSGAWTLRRWGMGSKGQEGNGRPSLLRAWRNCIAGALRQDPNAGRRGRSRELSSWKLYGCSPPGSGSTGSVLVKDCASGSSLPTSRRST